MRQPHALWHVPPIPFTFAAVHSLCNDAHWRFVEVARIVRRVPFLHPREAQLNTVRRRRIDSAHAPVRPQHDDAVTHAQVLKARSEWFRAGLHPRQPSFDSVVQLAE